MNKNESLKTIMELWLERPKKDRHTMYFFNEFYPDLEQKKPELLMWRMSAGGIRDAEVMGYLMKKNLLSVSK
jgi:hypothetical protein